MSTSFFLCAELPVHVHGLRYVGTNNTLCGLKSFIKEIVGYYS